MLSSCMERSIPLIIFLNQLLKEGVVLHNLLDHFKRVVFCCDMEDCLELIILHVEILFPLVEVDPDHFYVVVFDRVEERKISIVVFSVWSRIYLLY